MPHYKLAALPGEGIGPEVLHAALIVLQKLAQQHNFTLSITEGLIGQPAHDQTGSWLPEVTAQLCESSDAIVFGAVSRGGLLELRQRFDLFANLRPIRPSPSLFAKSPLKPDLLKSVDILFVRELVSGIYFGKSGRSQDSYGKYGFHTMHYHDWEIQRIAKVALQLAHLRQQKVTIAHKENALPKIPWMRIVTAEAHAFPEVLVNTMLVDNLAMQLVMNPGQFDVIVAGNLFGDILSDIGGALVGSIGLLGSASLNGQGFGLYEPIHGTAPDIAGKGVANPMGMIASIGLMLQQWDQQEAASRLAGSQEALLAAGYRTADLYEPSQSAEQLVSTQGWVDLTLESLDLLV